MSLTNESLIKLNRNCQAQIEQFKNSQPSNESPSCLEILRRAVAGNDDAWGILLDITREHIVKAYVGRTCPPELHDEQEDIIQDVLIRLDNRIRRPTKQPYNVKTFPQYWKFVQITVKTEITEHRKLAARRQQIDQALEEEAQAPNLTAEFTNDESFSLIHARFQEWADKASESKRINILRQWKAIDLRHSVGKTNQEIAQDFREIDPTITARQVSKYVERGLDRIRKDAYLRHLFGLSHDQKED